jgi:hypothetical protein
MFSISPTASEALKFMQVKYRR